MVGALGDRVRRWTTLNEPWCSAFLGYASGVHAPGRTDPADALAAVHHLNLAHGLAGRAVRAALGDRRRAVAHAQPARGAAGHATPLEDREAVRRIDAVANRSFLEPVLDGVYPADLLADTASITDWSFVRDGDLEITHTGLDVLGVNYYSTQRVRQARRRCAPLDGRRSPGLGRTRRGSAPATSSSCPCPARHTAMGWNIDPDGVHRAPRGPVADATRTCR